MQHCIYLLLTGNAGFGLDLNLVLKEARVVRFPYSVMAIAPVPVS
jgi:hypothetical protein